MTTIKNHIEDDDLNLPENKYRSKTVLPKVKRTNSLEEEIKLKISSNEMFNNYFNKIDEYIKFIDVIMQSYSSEITKNDYIKLKEDIFSEKDYINEIFKVLKIKEREYNKLAILDKQFRMTGEEEKMLFGELDTFNLTKDFTDLRVLHK